VRRALGDRPALCAAVAEQQQGAVGVAAREIDVVHHHHHAHAGFAGAAGQQLQHGNLVVEVEVRERFVEQREPWVLGQQRGHGEALAFAAGKRMHVALFQFREAHGR
jgi:hypothetical protein